MFLYLKNILDLRQNPKTNFISILSMSFQAGIYLFIVNNGTPEQYVKSVQI